MHSEELQRLLEDPGNSLLRTVLHALPCGASIALDGKIVYSNNVCAQMWGFDHGGLMRGRSLFDLVAEEWREVVIRLFAARSAGDDAPWTYELEGKRHDGTVFPYRINSMSFHTPMGRASIAFFTEIERCALGAAQQMERLHEIIGDGSEA